MSADAKDRFDAAIEALRQNLHAAFNPPGSRPVTFTLMICETGKIDPSEFFMVSHISNADNFEDQIAMAKAFIAKCELFTAEIMGGVQ